MGVYSTVEKIAAAEKLNASYVSRVLRLTLFVPDIVDAILDGRRQPPTIQLKDPLRQLSGNLKFELFAAKRLHSANSALRPMPSVRPEPFPLKRA